MPQNTATGLAEATFFVVYFFYTALFFVIEKPRPKTDTVAK
jgi:hypothetical protein